MLAKQIDFSLAKLAAQPSAKDLEDYELGTKSIESELTLMWQLSKKHQQFLKMERAFA